MALTLDRREETTSLKYIKRSQRMFEKSQADARRLRIRRVAIAAKPSETALYNPGEACDLERTLPTFDDNILLQQASQEGRWHAQGYFSKWYSRARRSRLEPVKKVAKSLKNHLDGLLNYFIHPITNAVTEGLNSRIQEIKANARGFRSFDNYRTRILFFCGKLNFFPA